MRDGLAIKNIRAKVPGERMAATVRSAQAFEAMQPFERLGKALPPPGQRVRGPRKSSGLICCGTAILAATVHGRDARGNSK